MRKQHGGAIIETGPALIILLLMVFFPLCDLVYLGCGFMFAWFLHDYELRQLAVSQPPPAGDPVSILRTVDNDFLNNSSGFAAFIGLNQTNFQSLVTHSWQYTPATNTDRGTVVLTTTVSLRPFLYIPVPPNVPGVSAPVVVTFVNQRPQEEDGQDGASGS